MSATSSMLTTAESREINWPGLGAVKVTVLRAHKTGPSAGWPSDGRPEGVSTARIRAGRAAVAFFDWRLMAEIALAITPVAAPRKPVPKIASTMTLALEISGQAVCQAVSSVIEITCLPIAVQLGKFVAASPCKPRGSEMR